MRWNMQMVRRGLVAAVIGAAVFFAAAQSSSLVFGGIVIANAGNIGAAFHNGTAKMERDVVQAIIFPAVDRTHRTDRMPLYDPFRIRGVFYPWNCFWSVAGCQWAART